MNKSIQVLLFLLLSNYSTAQGFLKNNKYSVESSVFLSTSDKLPFWLRSNQYGEVPTESQFFQIGGQVHHEYDSLFNKNKKLNKFSYGYGARSIVNVGKVNQFRLTEGYLKVRHGVFEIYVGRRREIIGLVDTLLTSGSYIWSSNASPIPKIQASIPNYTPILRNGLISIKASFAHGWLGSTDSVKNYFIHQKSFYARIGKASWKLNFYAGLNHQVQWGGKPVMPFYDPQTNQTISQFPSNFATYLNVVTGLSLNRKLDAGDIKDGVPYNEAFNRTGNHLGTIDLAIDFKTSFGNFSVYRQNIYEDGSLFYLSNISDGLTGISLTPKINQTKFRIKKINLEYLNTNNQGGPRGSDNTIPELRGRDNYFNNSIYQDGYTYKDQTIGTPYILPLSNYKKHFSELELSQLNSNFLLNNRIEAINIGILANYAQKFQMLYKYSFSNNKGNYSHPFSEKQTSFIGELAYRGNNGIICQISLSIDNGTLLEKNYGTGISITKVFL